MKPFKLFLKALVLTLESAYRRFLFVFGHVDTSEEVLLVGATFGVRIWA